MQDRNNWKKVQRLETRGKGMVRRANEVKEDLETISEEAIEEISVLTTMKPFLITVCYPPYEKKQFVKLYFSILMHVIIVVVLLVIKHRILHVIMPIVAKILPKHNYRKMNTQFCFVKAVS